MNHLASVSSWLWRVLVLKQSLHFWNLTPAGESEYAASEHGMSLALVLDAVALQGLSAGEARHKPAQGEPGETWIA